MKQNILKLEKSAKILSKYIIGEEYKGFDPYDGLSSPLFKLPFLKSNKLARFGFQQLFRRIPINLRSILRIRKEVNPVTLGLSIQSFAYLSQVFRADEDYYKEQIDICLDKLIALKSPGYSGSCWGYNFDWEARYAKIDAYTPTIVATGFIINGLYEYYKISNNSKAKELILDSSKFVLNDLNRTYEGDNYCFSYSPNDNQVVFNATMKAARLLAQAYDLSKDEMFKIEATKTVNFVMNYQAVEGYWSYSSGDARTWVDNFHTAYVLDALKSYIELTGNRNYDLNLIKGFSYYKKNFITNDFIPKYFNNSLYPIDSTAVSQTILTLAQFEEIDLALKASNWAVVNFLSKKGSFYYRKYKYFTNRISYMRWSNAWFLVSLSMLLYKIYKEK